MPVIHSTTILESVIILTGKAAEHKQDESTNTSCEVFEDDRNMDCSPIYIDNQVLMASCNLYEYGYCVGYTIFC